ncbi:MAG: hypothetical protein R3C44_12545 [Chloroflexota bacterium]
MASAILTRQVTPYATGPCLLGRQAELDSLNERLEQGVHTAVVGPPEIASPVYQIKANPLIATEALVAFVDLSDARYQTAAGFSQALWSQWWSRIQPGHVPEIGGLDVLDPLVRRLVGKGHKLVAVLDEYEQLIWRPSRFDSAYTGLETLIREGLITVG